MMSRSLLPTMAALATIALAACGFLLAGPGPVRGLAPTGLPIAAFLLGGALAVCLSLWALGRQVRERLSRLSTEVEALGRSGDPSARLAVEGSCELGRLTEQCNLMLERLERNASDRDQHDTLLKSFFDHAELMRGILESDGEDLVHVVHNARAEQLFGVDSAEDALARYVASPPYSAVNE